MAYGKYVQLDTGEYRLSMWADHAELAKGEKVKSAGLWKVTENDFVVEGHSTTLKVGWSNEDVEFFQRTFGVAQKREW